LSALTKIFVVLLVVSSLLLSAAVVVFVNRVESFNTTLTTTKTQLAAAKRDLSSATTNLETSMQSYNQLQAEMTRQTGDLNRQLVDKDTAMQKLEGENTQLKKDAQVAAATQKGTADLARAAQEENKGLQQGNAELRNKMDELVKQNGELNTQVTVLDNRLRAVDREREYLQERLAEAQNQMKNAPRGGTGAAGGEATPASAAASGPINGVVRSVDVIGGKKYATISVGSADNVTKGMRFNVVDRNGGQFLGYLTVDSVQQNEAIGQLEGKVDKVQPGVEVKTQL
jgi:phage shock protein A